MEESHIYKTLPSNNYSVNRPFYDTNHFENSFKTNEVDSFNEFKLEIKKTCNNTCSTNGLIKLLLSNFPIIGTIRNYKKSYILYDLIAGFTMCIFHIPQGLAYGLLAGLLPVNGLYTSLFPVIIYLALASSNHLSVGTFALMSLLVAEPVERLSADFIPSNTSNPLDNSSLSTDLSPVEHYRLLIAISVSFLAGLIQFLLGVFHLGFIVNFLSDSMISGFTTGAAVQVATSQFPSILGYSVKKYSGIKKLFLTYYDLFRKLAETNIATLLTSIACMVILILFKEVINPRVKKKIPLPIPSELIVLVIGTVISFLASFNSRFGVDIVGPVPSGLPSPVLPDPSIFPLVASDAVTIAIVAFSIAAALAKMFASRFNQTIDFNQELKAHGLANMFTSFFQGFFAGAALARTTTVVEVGMKTQLASVVSCILMLLVLLVIGPLFESVPKCLLSAIILVALKGLFKQIFDLKRLWNISIFDFLTWIVACLATVVLDVTMGLIFGLVFSIITVLIRSQIPSYGLLGRIPDTDIYKDLRIYDKADEIDGVKIFRFEAPLYFANCEQFKDLLFKSVFIDEEKSNCDETIVDGTHRTKSREHVSEPSVSVVCADGVMTTAFNRLHGLSDPDGNSSGRVDISVAESSPLNKETQHVIKSSIDKVSVIIIDFSCIPFVDSTGVKVMREILQTLKLKKLHVLLAQCNEAVRTLFLKTDIHKIYDKEIMFLTIHDALLSLRS